jgi:cold shock CspA family protein
VTGHITRLIRSRSCGFIRAANGQDVFFHASDVFGLSFHDLEDRAVVRFTLIDDRVSGPRAAEVRLAAPGRA